MSKYIFEVLTLVICGTQMKNRINIFENHTPSREQIDRFLKIIENCVKQTNLTSCKQPQQKPRL